MVGGVDAAFLEASKEGLTQDYAKRPQRLGRFLFGIGINTKR